MKLSDGYSIVDYVASGSFGDVYIAIDYNGQLVAIKVEERKGRQKILREYKIYKDLSKSFFKGLPKVYNFIVTPKYNIMTMQLLGHSLDELYEDSDKQFNMATIFNIAIQLVRLLRDFHQGGYIHRDIKPNNFLSGNDDNDKQLYIMDFGLSKQYIHNGKHIPMITGRSLIGTARYASINMHQGYEPSRRDDMISVGYMLIYFIKGELPWQGVRKTANFLEDIGHIKEIVTIDELCENTPKCFADYLKYCTSLKFTEIPDYNWMESLFVNSAMIEGVEPSFEWCT